MNIYTTTKDGQKHNITSKEASRAWEDYSKYVSEEVRTDDGTVATAWERATLFMFGYEHYVLLFEAGYNSHWFAAFDDVKKARTVMAEINFAFPVAD